LRTLRSYAIYDALTSVAVALNCDLRLESPPVFKCASANHRKSRAHVAEIARGCGFIQMVDGPGERHLPVSLRAVRGRFLCWRVRRFHPFAARNGFNPNKRVGNDMRKCSKLRGLSDAYNFFLRGPKEGRSIRSAKASAVSSGGCLPAAIISTIFGARNANRINRLT
jgi:hypothetical protein